VEVKKNLLVVCLTIPCPLDAINETYNTYVRIILFLFIKKIPNLSAVNTISNVLIRGTVSLPRPSFFLGKSKENKQHHAKKCLNHP
jgi:hypothetical protein